MFAEIDLSRLSKISTNEKTCLSLYLSSPKSMSDLEKKFDRIRRVLRGDDHLSNTPKQVLLYRALGLPEPVFAHVPMILGQDGKKLSKRHGVTAVGDYAKEGILPEAMLNFLALLGWSPGGDREFMTAEELIEAFTTERLLKSSSVFDVEKLQWLNGRHLAARPDQELAAHIRSFLSDEPSLRPDLLDDPSWLAALLEVIKVRARTLDELADQARPFVCDELHYEPKAVEKHWLKDPEAAIERLERVWEVYRETPWTATALEATLRELATAMEVGAGKLIHPLRVASTGNMASPGIFDVLVLLGRARVGERLSRALERIRSG